MKYSGLKVYKSAPLSNLKVVLNVSLTLPVFFGRREGRTGCATRARGAMFCLHMQWEVEAGKQMVAINTDGVSQTFLYSSFSGR